jgi:hypothetical protein
MTGHCPTTSRSASHLGTATVMLVAALLLLATGCANNASPNAGDTDSAAASSETTQTPSQPETPAAEAPTSTRVRDLSHSGVGPDLWVELSSGFYRTKWDRAPGYDTRQPATGPHGDEVEIFVSPSVSEGLAQGHLTEWPAGSSVVKDAYAGDELAFVALMQKRGDVWYWAEYRPDGSIVAEGLDTPSCAKCHSEGDDYVRGFSLP